MTNSIEITDKDLYLDEAEIWRKSYQSDCNYEYLPHDLNTEGLEGYHCVALNDGPAQSDIVELLSNMNTKKYIPGKVFFALDKVSALTQQQQTLCLNALLITQKGCDPSRLSVHETDILKKASKYNHIIRQENIEFLEHAKQDWEKVKYRANKIAKNVKQYAYKVLKNKLDSVLSYPQYYSGFNVLPLSYNENQSQVEVTHLRNVLDLGTVGQFNVPSLVTQCKLEKKQLPEQNIHGTYAFQLPVSQDFNVFNILENEPVDVVISSSALKCIMDDSNYEEEWNIPILIKNIQSKHPDGNEYSKKIVFVDKTLPNRVTTFSNFNYYCAKQLIKKKLCHTRKLVFSKEVLIKDSNYVPKESGPKCKTERQQSADAVLGQQIENDYQKELEEFNELKYNKNCVQEKSSAATFIKAKSISPNFVYSVEPINELGTPDSSHIEDNEGEVCYNVSYRTWSMKMKNEQNVLMKTRSLTKAITVLVRCKADAYQLVQNMNEPQVVTVVPKFEYQTEHGANIPTKKEINNQWTSLFFRPMSHLYRIRIQSDNFTIVDTESVCLQKLNREAVTHYKSKPNVRLDVLHRILATLTEYPPAYYLLHHTKNNEAFVEVLKNHSAPHLKTLPPPSELYDLHLHNSGKCHVMCRNKLWIPIDVNYVLPVHSSFKRMPGLFRPLLGEPKKGKRKKKGKRNKAKSKIKAINQ